MALPAIMLGLQITGWIFFLPGAMVGHCDFRHLYVAGYMVRTGHRTELYDYSREKQFQDALVSPESVALPFNHLAYESLLFVPYSEFSYRVAYFLFLATNVGLLLWALHIFSPRMTSLHELLFWLPAAMFLTFLPVAAAFMQGQDSILLLLLITAAFTLLYRRQTFLAGFMVGLALFKFQIVIPIAALFLLWRRWRFVAGAIMSGCLALLISLWLVGQAQMKAYGESLLSMSVKETAADQVKFNIVPAMMPNIRGFVSGVAGSFVSAHSIQWAIAVISIAIFGWTAIKGARFDLVRQMLLAIIAACLTSYHLIIHDLSILLLPLAVVLNGYFSGKCDRISALAATLVFSAPALIALSDLRPWVVAIAVLFFWFVQTQSHLAEPAEV